MTVVVTGASGHLGTDLVRALAGTDDIRLTVHRNRLTLDGIDAEQVKADVADAASMRAAFDGADTVYHLAARISVDGDPDGSVHRTNVEGVRNVATAALDAGVKRFVHVSSVHAFDLSSSRGPLDEGAVRSGPKNYAYDQSKALGEEALRSVIDAGLDAVIVNPTGVIGPLDFGPSRMGHVFLDLAHRRLPSLVAGGFDFVDVRDVVAGMMAAAKHGATGENYLLGGHFLTVRDIARLAATATGTRAPRLTVPIWLAALGVPFARATARRTGTEPKFTYESLGALRHGVPIDSGKARRDLGYRPRDAADTVRDIYAWFEAQGMWRRP